MAEDLLRRFVEHHNVHALHKLLEMFQDESKNDEIIDAVKSVGPKRLIDVLVSENTNEKNDFLRFAEKVQLIAECVRNLTLRNELTCDILIIQLLNILQQTDSFDLESNQAELVKQICRVLGNLCFDNDAAREIVMDNDGLKILLKLIRTLLEGARSPSGLLIEEKLAMIVMGCLFNVADNDDCQKKFQQMDVLPLLIDCVAIMPGDAGCHATNLLYNMSDSEEWHHQFVVNMPSLLRIVDTVEDQEMLEMLIDVIQTVFIKADKSEKITLFEFGLWDHLRKIVDKGVLVKQAASLMVIMLADDGCMQRMFAGGEGPQYLLMREWLNNDSKELRTYGALAIGNFARRDDLCVILANDGVAAQLINMLGSMRSTKLQEIEALEDAILAGLRNLLIPKENKRSLIQSGIVDKLLSLLPIESYVVAFKYLACMRMLVDRQPDVALRLGSNHDLLRAIVTWSRVELHVGVKSEAMRALCWILKNNSSDLVRSAVAIEGGVPAIVEMLKSEHTVMQNEAVIALSLLANGNPPEDVRQALASNLNQTAELIGDIINTIVSSSNNAAIMANEFIENIVTLVINVCIIRIEFREAIATKVETPLNELNRLTQYFSLKDKICKALHILGDNK